jgi:methylamine---glutamate N-methyltransferase subunit A
MCGIAGLYSKTPDFQARLGSDLAKMLEQLSFRGPDSAGVAFYRDPAPFGSSKVSLFSDEPGYDWEGLHVELEVEFGEASEPSIRASHATFVIAADAADAQAWLAAQHPELRLMSAGSTIEIFKEAGPPAAFVKRFALQEIAGTHALGHTRMATESRVTTQHSHPFSTGLDLCLVHNGSLSNHNRLRRALMREGIQFQTDNDTEVAAGYLTWKLREGASLEQALESCMDDLDGFYTFAVGTADGFAVLRDPIACKPAVMAETDEWVAMASEYRAIAVLPGAQDAAMWEPEPGQVYSWGHAPVA